MSIADQINRISTQKNKIRDKMRAMGLIEQNASPSIDVLADTLNNNVTVYNGETSIPVLEGSSKTIEPGYYKTEVTVYGVTNETADRQKIKSFETAIIPTKSKQDFIVPEGYYGFGSFTVNAIGDAYKDTSDANKVTEADVLANKVFYNSDGRHIGKMDNYGTLNKTFTYDDTTTPTITLGKGFYEGGTIGISVDTTVKEVTPSDGDQLIQPQGTGAPFFLGVKVLGDENLAPENIADKTTIFGVKGSFTSDANISVVTSNGKATSSDMLEGATAYAGGVKVTGSIPVHEDKQIILSLSKTHEDLSDKYYSTSTVSIVTEDQKVVTPDKTGCTISPTKDQYNRDRVLSTVKVLPIPDKYQDVSGVTAVASNVLEDTFFVTKGGVLTEGTMPSFGTVERTINWTDLSQTPYYSGTFQGYVTGISVSVNTSTLEEDLSEI